MAYPQRIDGNVSLSDIIFNEILSTLESILRKGGPDPEEYSLLTEKCHFLNSVELTLKQEHSLYKLLSPILNLNSMIGFSYLKPHGYAGDFEQIDRIYKKWTHQNIDLFSKWDDFYHNLAAATAVRNRKNYIQVELSKLEETENPVVLNLGSGPCSDIKQYLDTNKDSKIRFDCLDMDTNAIEYGKNKCEKYLDQIKFLNANAFRYKPEHDYDLIWSAGLFDYFKDKLFKRLINRYFQQLKPTGKLIIGNFAEGNESKGVMEIFGQWYLHHRNKNQMIDLADSSGINAKKIFVDAENTGVNLFLHIYK